MPAPVNPKPDMRSALLSAAIEEFGEHGFDAVGTRRIADICGTAMSSITYHFKGKEGLYLAAADHIAEQITAFLAPTLEAISVEDCKAPKEAIAAIVSLLDRFAQMMLDERSGHWVQFIIREQHHPTAAFERLFTGAMRPVLEKALSLIRVARPDFDDGEARATAILLWSQAVILRSGRASVARIFGTSGIEPNTARLLRRSIAKQTEAILRMDQGTPE